MVIWLLIVEGLEKGLRATYTESVKVNCFWLFKEGSSFFTFIDKRNL